MKRRPPHFFNERGVGLPVARTDTHDFRDQGRPKAVRNKIRQSGFTGLTRDGTFLIENGKIARPVTNFRFNQSLAELLTKVDMPGRSTRVSADESSSAATPVVVPALKVKDFTLSSQRRNLSDMLKFDYEKHESDSISITCRRNSARTRPGCC